MDLVTLDLDLDCIVGILPRERVTPQTLQASLEMELDLERTATTGDLDQSLDYAQADAMVRALATDGRFLLIETLAMTALRWLLSPPGPGEARASVAAATVHLRKPQVMPRALPGVRLRRQAHQVQVPRVVVADGVAERVLADLDEVLVRRVEVDAGAVYTPAPGAAVSFGNGAGPCTLLVVEYRGAPQDPAE